MTPCGMHRRDKNAFHTQTLVHFLHKVLSIEFELPKNPLVFELLFFGLPR